MDQKNKVEVIEGKTPVPPPANVFKSIMWEKGWPERHPAIKALIRCLNPTDEDERFWFPRIDSTNNRYFPYEIFYVGAEHDGHRVVGLVMNVFGGGHYDAFKCLRGRLSVKEEEIRGGGTIKCDVLDKRLTIAAGSAHFGDGPKWIHEAVVGYLKQHTELKGFRLSHFF